MSLQRIKNLTQNKSSDAFKSIIYGYVKSLSDKEAAEYLKQYALDKQLSTPIFRRVLEIEDLGTRDDLCKHFITRLAKQPKFDEKKRYGYYLNQLIEKCSDTVKAEIISLFLNSGKRYFRKYAYKQHNLNDYGLLDLAWEIVNKNPAEATFLIRTLAYHGDIKLVQKYFHQAIRHPGVEEYQVRQLFKRLLNIATTNWEWLKEHYPSSYLYIAAIKNHSISNNECHQIYNNLISQHDSDSEHEVYSSKPDIGLLLWCLARLHKWKAIEQILDEHYD